MSIIDASGLFDGDRFDLMSDEARLFWPHFWCASNGVGRIELNYRKVVGTAFKRWRSPPTEEQFNHLVIEYRDAYLLFVYEVAGQFWGQWYTSEKFLPKYKSNSDSKTPAPDPIAFDAWKVAYSNLRHNKPNGFNVFGNFTSGPGKFPIGIGVGVSEGVVVGVAVVDGEENDDAHKKTIPINFPKMPGEMIAAEWPETVNAIGAFFIPDDEIVIRIVAEAIKVQPTVTDAEIGRAVVSCHVNHQASAGMFLTTVPRYLAARARGQPIKKAKSGGVFAEFSKQMIEEGDGKHEAKH